MTYNANKEDNSKPLGNKFFDGANFREADFLGVDLRGNTFIALALPLETVVPKFNDLV